MSFTVSRFRFEVRRNWRSRSSWSRRGHNVVKTPSPLNRLDALLLRRITVPHDPGMSGRSLVVDRGHVAHGHGLTLFRVGVFQGRGHRLDVELGSEVQCRRFSRVTGACWKPLSSGTGAFLWRGTGSGGTNALPAQASGSCKEPCRISRASPWSIRDASAAPALGPQRRERPD